MLDIVKTVNCAVKFVTCEPVVGLDCTSTAK